MSAAATGTSGGAIPPAIEFSTVTPGVLAEGGAKFKAGEGFFVSINGTERRVKNLTLTTGGKTEQLKEEMDILKRGGTLNPAQQARVKHILSAINTLFAPKIIDEVSKTGGALTVSAQYKMDRTKAEPSVLEQRIAITPDGGAEKAAPEYTHHEIRQIDTIFRSVFGAKPHVMPDGSPCPLLPSLEFSHVDTPSGSKIEDEESDNKPKDIEGKKEKYIKDRGGHNIVMNAVKNHYSTVAVNAINNGNIISNNIPNDNKEGEMKSYHAEFEEYRTSLTQLRKELANNNNDGLNSNLIKQIDEDIIQIESDLKFLSEAIQCYSDPIKWNTFMVQEAIKKIDTSATERPKNATAIAQNLNNVRIYEGPINNERTRVVSWLLNGTISVTGSNIVKSPEDLTDKLNKLEAEFKEKQTNHSKSMKELRTFVDQYSVEAISQGLINNGKVNKPNNVDFEKYPKETNDYYERLNAMNSEISKITKNEKNKKQIEDLQKQIKEESSKIIELGKLNREKDITFCYDIAKYEWDYRMAESVIKSIESDTLPATTDLRALADNLPKVTLTDNSLIERRTAAIAKLQSKIDANKKSEPIVPTGPATSVNTAKFDDIQKEFQTEKDRHSLFITQLQNHFFTRAYDTLNTGEIENGLAKRSETALKTYKGNYEQYQNYNTFLLNKQSELSKITPSTPQIEELQKQITAELTLVGDFNTPGTNLKFLADLQSKNENPYFQYNDRIASNVIPRILSGKPPPLPADTNWSKFADSLENLKLLERSPINSERQMAVAELRAKIKTDNPPPPPTSPTPPIQSSGPISPIKEETFESEIEKLKTRQKELRREQMEIRKQTSGLLSTSPTVEQVGDMSIKISNQLKKLRTELISLEEQIQKKGLAATNSPKEQYIGELNTAIRNISSNSEQYPGWIPELRKMETQLAAKKAEIEQQKQQNIEKLKNLFSTNAKPVETAKNTEDLSKLPESSSTTQQTTPISESQKKINAFKDQLNLLEETDKKLKQEHSEVMRSPNLVDNHRTALIAQQRNLDKLEHPKPSDALNEIRFNGLKLSTARMLNDLNRPQGGLETPSPTANPLPESLTEFSKISEMPVQATVSKVKPSLKRSASSPNLSHPPNISKKNDSTAPSQGTATDDSSKLETSADETFPVNSIDDTDDFPVITVKDDEPEKKATIASPKPSRSEEIETGLFDTDIDVEEDFEGEKADKESSTITSQKKQDKTTPTTGDKGWFKTNNISAPTAPSESTPVSFIRQAAQLKRTNALSDLHAPTEKRAIDTSVANLKDLPADKILTSPHLLTFVNNWESLLIKQQKLQREISSHQGSDLKDLTSQKEAIDKAIDEARKSFATHIEPKLALEEDEETPVNILLSDGGVDIIAAGREQHFKPVVLKSMLIGLIKPESTVPSNDGPIKNNQAFSKMMKKLDDAFPLKADMIRQDPLFIELRNARLTNQAGQPPASSRHAVASPHTAVAQSSPQPKIPTTNERQQSISKENTETTSTPQPATSAPNKQESTTTSSTPQPTTPSPTTPESTTTSATPQPTFIRKASTSTTLQPQRARLEPTTDHPLTANQKSTVDAEKTELQKRAASIKDSDVHAALAKLLEPGSKVRGGANTANILKGYDEARNAIPKKEVLARSGTDISVMAKYMRSLETMKTNKEAFQLWLNSVQTTLGEKSDIVFTLKAKLSSMEKEIESTRAMLLEVTQTRTADPIATAKIQNYNRMDSYWNDIGTNADKQEKCKDAILKNLVLGMLSNDNNQLKTAYNNLTSVADLNENFKRRLLSDKNLTDVVGSVKSRLK